MVKTYAYGFPRIGKNREYKKVIESFWKNEIRDNGELINDIKNIENDILKTYKNNVDSYPTNEMTLYDKMLDMAILLGRYNPDDLDEYYELCRGKNCLEMTKWFNTNYHYLVPDLTGWNGTEFYHNENFTITGDNPHLIGPFTFLKLSKGIAKDKFKDFAIHLAKTYRDIIKNYTQVHLDEPCFVLDLDSEEIAIIKDMYDIMSDTKINVFTYYEDVDWLTELFALPVNGIGLDFVNGRNNLKNVLSMGSTLLKDKVLYAGFVDGINVWKTDIKHATVNIDYLSKMAKEVVVTNAGPLYHLPVTIENEKNLPDYLYGSLSFATEKLEELNAIKIRDSIGYRKHIGMGDEIISMRVDNLKDEDFVKPINVVERRKLQDKILNLPELPTTTIGSFPQTPEVRKNRLDYKKGRISEEEYNSNVERFTKEAIDIQEEIGMDVLVHGEFERTDMVEHFCQRMDGVNSHR